MGYFGRDRATKRGSSCPTHLAGECSRKQFDPRDSGCRLLRWAPRAYQSLTLGRASGICRGFLCLRTTSGKRDCSGPWVQACVHYRRRGLGKKSRIANLSICLTSLERRRRAQKRLNRPHSLCKFPKQPYRRDC